MIDIIGTLLQDNGFDEFVINAGGDILHSTLQSEPLQVGLENPFNTQEIIGIAAINNQSICASAGSRRKWAQYTHIIDPKSLESPQAIQATWVIAQSAMLADGLATALFFVPAAKLQPQFSFDYAILHHDMALHSSSAFPFVTLNQA